MFRLVLCTLMFISIQSTAAFAAGSDVLGIWKGTFYCYPYNQAFTLSILPDASGESELSAELSYEIIDPAGRDKGGGKMVSSGTFDAKAFTLSLASNRRKSEGRHYDMVALIDNGRIIGRFPNATPGTCTFITGDRNGGLNVPDDPQERLSPADMQALRGQQKEFLRTTDLPALCDRVVRWVRRLKEEFPGDTNGAMNKLYDASLPLLGDVEFEAFFGKRFDELTLSDRSNMTAVLRSGCRGSFGRDELGLSMIAAGAFKETGQGGRRQSLSAAHGIRLLRSWRDDVLAVVQGMQASVDAIERLDGYLRAAEAHFPPLWPSERAAFNATVDAAAKRLAPATAIARAEAAAAAAKGYDGLVSLAAWPQENASLLGRLDAGQGQAAGDIVARRIDVVLRELVPAEEQAIPLEGTDRTALDETTRWYQDFSRRYSFVLGHEALAGLQGQFARRRGEILSALAPALVAQIGSLGDAREVDALLSEVLAVPGDRATEGGKTIAAAGEARWQVLERDRFLARFSKREQDLMNGDGVLAVPGGYEEPTGEEVRLAMLREIASMGGSQIDERRAQLSIPPFGALGFGVEVTLGDASSLSCKPQAPGYECTFTMPMQNRIPDEVRQFFASNPLYSKMVDLMAVALDLQREFSGTDEFVLTASGWRSPTAAARRLEGIVSHYDAMAEAAGDMADINCASLWGQTDWGQSLCQN